MSHYIIIIIVFVFYFKSRKFLGLSQAFLFLIQFLPTNAIIKRSEPELSLFLIGRGTLSEPPEVEEKNS